MSDIYLQITETPTVVTLSAPVVSGALASTVTVANTVTVALDSNSLSALENVTVTVGAAITGTVTVGNFPATQAVSLASVPTHGVNLTSTTVTVSSIPAISGTVTISNFPSTQLVEVDGGAITVQNFPETQPVSLTTLPALVAGTAQIGSVTIGNSITIGSCVTHGVTIANSSVTVNGSFFQATQPVSLTTLPALVAGTAQIGSVTASISGTVPISISSVTVGNSVTIGSLPAISGTVTANTFALQGTAVTTSNFTSTTASTVLANFNATREVLTIFNEGAGLLFLCPGALCTTTAYQVRLSAGDYYEVPNHQTTITHSAVFATAGTARVTQVS